MERMEGMEGMEGRERREEMVKEIKPQLSAAFEEDAITLATMIALKPSSKK